MPNVPSYIRLCAQDRENRDRKWVVRLACDSDELHSFRSYGEDTRRKERTMSYFPQLAAENDLPALAAAKSAFEFVPNFYRAQTKRPGLIAAEAQLVNALLIQEGAVTRQQKEYVFLVCSAANL